ncbi:MAG: DUF484 family protein [Gammaproteobacteria bacterium]
MASHSSSDTGPADNRLRQRLRRLLDEAHRNEYTLRRFQTLELELLGCGSLVELMQMLLYDNREAFAWDVVTVALLDPEYELRRLVDRIGLPEDTRDDIIFATEPEALHDREPGNKQRPHLGAFDESAHAALFPRLAAPLASVAILPLARNDMPIGSLNIGSHNRQRFRRDTGTEFLQHLAAVISVCLETSVNQERLKYIGLTDSLTGINNRRFFDQRLTEEIARPQRSGLPLSGLLIDIDHFKTINDDHGHLAGDKALQTVAALIREQLRNIDVVARYGGEEFAVLLADADEHKAADVAERIRLSVAERIFRTDGSTRLHLTVSIGVSTLHPKRDVQQPDYAHLGTQLIEAADRALYEAKRAGRNRVVTA